MGAYRRELRRVVGGAAIPYGYTLATWSTGSMLIRTHGRPTLLEAVAFLVGATLGFALAAGAGGGGAPDPTPLDARALGVASGLAAIAALVSAAGVAETVKSDIAFGIAPLVGTIVYFLASAAGARTIAGRARR